MAQISPSELLAQLKSYSTNPPKELETDTDLTTQLYHATQSALRAFESPSELISRIAVAQQAEWAVMRIGCEMGLFPALGNVIKTAAQLETELTAEPALLLRILRAGVGFGAIKEVGEDGYTLAPSYAQLATPEAAWALPKFADFVHKNFYATPELLKMTGYKNPADPLNTAMQLAFDAPGKKPYEILASKPEAAKGVGAMMALMGMRPSQRVQNSYPFKQRLMDGFDPSTSDVLFIDVGAGHSHVIASIKETIPDVPGRLIAQDLPYMIQNAPADVKYEMHEHDFFTEQPIKGARAYYIRLCLHNWDDETVIEILSHLHDAMKPGYSRLIVHEQVVLERNTQMWVAAADLSQMGACASLERTEVQWRDILRRVGFSQVALFWPTDPSSEVAIEAVR